MSNSIYGGKIWIVVLPNGEEERIRADSVAIQGNGVLILQSGQGSPDKEALVPPFNVLFHPDGWRAVYATGATGLRSYFVGENGEDAPR